MKKKKGPLILTGVLVILLILYLGLSSWNKKQDKKEEKETVKVTDLDESTITAIKYQVAAGEMSFEKDVDTWYYSEDKDFPLKQSEPEKIAKAAAQITADRKLEDGDSLDAYGLDDPNYYIVINRDHGRRRNSNNSQLRRFNRNRLLCNGGRYRCCLYGRIQRVG